ncbi:N-acyl amino acid synthase FeeM domain-containing protein [Lacisediminimonas profundi]|uniref:N-acyl amino acid synthase FeeM domain-containing protein n=1 Tax=Lacisediminimonas profundi TaxID=2603856 RepID=UPI00124AFE52|nr:hypothetical protein [Lacisediminimonas profundi]
MNTAIFPAWNPAIFDWTGALDFAVRPIQEIPVNGNSPRSDGTVRVSFATDTASRRKAAYLTKFAYEKLGYDTAFMQHDIRGEAPQPELLTFLFHRNDYLLGTYSIRLETRAGVLADRSYGAELEALRARGASIIELGRFAIEPDLASGASRKVQAVMLNFLAMLCQEFLDPRPVLIADIDPLHAWKPQLVMEVTPRHALVWTGLGWKRNGPERRCERVNTASVLLSVRCQDLAHATNPDSDDMTTIAWKFLSRYFVPRPRLEEIRQGLRQALASASQPPVAQDCTTAHLDENNLAHSGEH